MASINLEMCKNLYYPTSKNTILAMWPETNSYNVILLSSRRNLIATSSNVISFVNMIQELSKKDHLNFQDKILNQSIPIKWQLIRTSTSRNLLQTGLLMINKNLLLDWQMMKDKKYLWNIRCFVIRLRLLVLSRRNKERK